MKTPKISRPETGVSSGASPRATIAILDFGSQYTQLIARRVRESRVYCEIFPHDVTPAELISAIVSEEGVHRAPYAFAAAVPA